jgi:hypothetical protein
MGAMSLAQLSWAWAARVLMDSRAARRIFLDMKVFVICNS